MALQIKTVAATKLHEPILLAAWPGMGHVALKAFVFLHEAMRARNLAFVEESDYFQLPAATIHNGIIESISKPRSGFYFCKRDVTGDDLLFFIGDQQPVPGKEHLLAEAVLDFAEQWGVKQVITAAAMPTSINHYQPSRVWVAATNEELLAYLSPYTSRILKEGHISGLNGLLLAVAKQKGMEGFCLLGEIPFYTSQIENPKASMAILRVLSRVLNLHLDLQKLEELTRETEKEIDRYLLELEQREKKEEEGEGPADDQKGPVTVH